MPAPVRDARAVCLCSFLFRRSREPPPRRVSVRVDAARTSRFKDVLRICTSERCPYLRVVTATSASSGVPWNKLILADVWQNKVHRFFCATDPVDEVTQQDDVVAYEVQDPQAYYPWTARQPLWRRQLCVPYDDRVQGYHAREDARKEDPLLATAVFNVGGRTTASTIVARRRERVGLRSLVFLCYPRHKKKNQYKKRSTIPIVRKRRKNGPNLHQNPSCRTRT